MIFLSACDDDHLNSPYPNEKPQADVYFASFSERPKTLDPAKAYSSNEYLFMYQIYEPPLQYDYLTRPYKLTTQSAASLPSVKYLDKNGQELNSADDKNLAYTLYTIAIAKGIKFAPHPAFAKDEHGQYRYHHLKQGFLEDNHINELQDFKYTGSRELLAADFVYQIKRLASPKIHSPIFGLMSQYIVGLKDLAKQLKQKSQSEDVDLTKEKLEGVTVLDDYHFAIKIKGYYPQFIYWLAMPFFSPMPWEADKFYYGSEMENKNITLAWYPIGTGPYMLSENNPNRRMVLIKNTNYRDIYFPTNGSLADKENGYLTNEGKKLPLIQKILFSLEKESIPRWNKFLQGYYDSSGVSSDSFDQAFRVTQKGKLLLTPMMEGKAISLQSAVDPSIYYMGFNMLDDVVGGKSERARLLRLAISIAINYEEYISIFLNGRGLVAGGPIPPGITGHQKAFNPYVYELKDNHVQRRSIREAREILAKAGYPGGRDKNGKQLILHYDATAGQGPEQKAYFEWLRKQFAKLGIALDVRATQYNRFQEKMRQGNAQIFSWGWHADYPDPENFLFLLYGKNSKVKDGGENAANYDNATFDKLFMQMKNLPNGEKREKVIKEMVDILQHDAPWVWGFYPKMFVLRHTWVSKTKLNSIGDNTLKYVSINVKERQRLRAVWNKPILWPLYAVLMILMIVFAPVLYTYYQRENTARTRID